MSSKAAVLGLDVKAAGVGAAVQTDQMLPQPGLLAVYGAGMSFS